MTAANQEKADLNRMLLLTEAFIIPPGRGVAAVMTADGVCGDSGYLRRV